MLPGETGERTHPYIVGLLAPAARQNLGPLTVTVLEPWMVIPGPFVLSWITNRATCGVTFFVFSGAGVKFRLSSSVVKFRCQVPVPARLYVPQQRLWVSVGLESPS